VGVFLVCVCDKHRACLDQRFFTGILEENFTEEINPTDAFGMKES
jgi:hypothetical protein